MRLVTLLHYRHSTTLTHSLTESEGDSLSLSDSQSHSDSSVSLSLCDCHFPGSWPGTPWQDCESVSGTGSSGTPSQSAGFVGTPVTVSHRVSVSHESVCCECHSLPLDCHCVTVTVDTCRLSRLLRSRFRRWSKT